MTVHAPVPVHAPFQPPKLQPGSGCATSVTVEPLTKSALQVVPQSIPGGVLVSRPLPVFEALSVNVPTSTATEALAVPPRPSLRVYEKLSCPSNPAAGVYLTVPFG